mmetsp:Transcript_1495/g.2387  ORF Transcript_1495/g.2387 Transcript_1495/m.2387 type:complete len:97 (+) Transcript_1495:244-534(+)
MLRLQFDRFFVTTYLGAAQQFNINRIALCLLRRVCMATTETHCIDIHHCRLHSSNNNITNNDSNSNNHCTLTLLVHLDLHAQRKHYRTSRQPEWPR